MGFTFYIDSTEFVAMTAKLERVSSKALPFAVRETLNKTALDVKKNSLEKSANKHFTRRQKNFFKASSSVNFAKGTDIDRMFSEVGFRAPSNSKNAGAVDNLEQQEKGGTIDNRELLPTRFSRISKSANRMVQSRNRLKNGSMKIVKSDSMNGKTKNKKFVQAILKAQKGGYVETDKSILRVDSVKKLKSGRLKFKLSTIYLKNPSKTINVKATNFMEEASLESFKKTPKIYKKEVKKQLDRYYR